MSGEAVIDQRLYVGAGTMGKSFAMRRHVGSSPRVLVWDPNYEPAWTGPTFGGVATSDPLELLELVKCKSFRLIWRPRLGFDKIEEVEILNRVAWAVGNLTLIWDEVHTIFGEGKRPQTGLHIITAGRHRGLRVWAATRRPTHLRDFTASATRLIAFRMAEPNDVHWLSQRIGPKAAQLSDMPPFHFIEKEEGKDAVFCNPVK
jgi:hypothetical protein